MLTTATDHGMRSRPMHAVPDRDTGCIWFITDQRGAKDEEIKAAPDVCLAFADTRSNTYLSMTGRAETLCDAAKARELWSHETQAWWPKGPTDPDVRVLRVVPDQAEYWDARGNSIAVALKLAAARLSAIRQTSARTIRWPCNNEKVAQVYSLMRVVLSGGARCSPQRGTQGGDLFSQPR
jgi:general stress protein 26